jgi:hypothetical protein
MWFFPARYEFSTSSTLPPLHYFCGFRSLRVFHSDTTGSPIGLRLVTRATRSAIGFSSSLVSDPTTGFLLIEVFQLALTLRSLLLPLEFSVYSSFYLIKRSQLLYPLHHATLFLALLQHHLSGVTSSHKGRMLGPDPNGPLDQRFMLLLSYLLYRFLYTP